MKTNILLRLLACFAALLSQSGCDFLAFDGAQRPYDRFVLSDPRFSDVVRNKDESLNQTLTATLTATVEFIPLDHHTLRIKEFGFVFSQGIDATLASSGARKVVIKKFPGDTGPLLTTDPRSGGVAKLGIKDPSSLTYPSVRVDISARFCRAYAKDSNGRTNYSFESVLIPVPPASTSDSGFSSNVKNSQVNAVALQPDGKIIMGGDFITVNGESHVNLARLEATGAPDATFTASTDFQIAAVAVQRDGKVVIAGNFSMVNGAPSSFLARLNADGSTDAGFATTGVGSVEAIAFQADEKILIGGVFTEVNGTERYCIARLETDGTLDETFD